MVRIYSDSGFGFSPPNRPKDKGRLEYRFDNEVGGHHIRELREIDLEKREQRLRDMWGSVLLGLFFLVGWLFLLAIQSSERRDFEGIQTFALYACGAIAVGCAWMSWDLWKKHVAETQIESEIEIYPTHIRIKRHGRTIYDTREKVKSAYVTIDGAWAEVERRDEDHCACDLLIFYWREHSELLWIAELVDRVLILGETPVETPPPSPGPLES